MKWNENVNFNYGHKLMLNYCVNMQKYVCP